jgi:hypothetical protein
MGTWDLMKIIM